MKANLIEIIEEVQKLACLAYDCADDVCDVHTCGGWDERNGDWKHPHLYCVELDNVRYEIDVRRRLPSAPAEFLSMLAPPTDRCDTCNGANVKCEKHWIDASQFGSPNGGH